VTRRTLAIFAVSGIAVAAAALAVTASAGSSAKQRIEIAFNQQAGTFVLTPLTAGPILRDSGKYSSCCWTRRDFTRD
jgi:hypothetical protein